MVYKNNFLHIIKFNLIKKHDTSVYSDNSMIKKRLEFYYQLNSKKIHKILAYKFYIIRYTKKIIYSIICYRRLPTSEIKYIIKYTSRSTDITDQKFTEISISLYRYWSFPSIPPANEITLEKRPHGVRRQGTRFASGSLARARRLARGRIGRHDVDRRTTQQRIEPHHLRGCK